MRSKGTRAADECEVELTEEMTDERLRALNA
jgi:hypothetical protein